MADSGGLVTTLSTSTQSFLQPSSSLHSEVLAYVKTILDPLAANVAAAQKSRRDVNRKKRKRSDVEREEEVLQLRQVYTDGLGVKQVWEQTRRILDASCKETERDIALHKTRVQPESQEQIASNGHDTDEVEASHGSEDEDEDEVFDDEDMQDDVLEDEDLDEEDSAEEFDDLEDVEDAGTGDSTSEADQEDPGTYVQDPNGLNDGFFSIDDFNKQTQFLEQQDVRGEDDNPSDEDEIDWDADPLTMAFHKPKATSASQDREGKGLSDVEEESDEEDGPTFGDADLNAEDTDDDMMSQGEEALDAGVDGLQNTNEVRYSDFFAPPPKKLSKTTRMRALPKTQPTKRPQAPDEDFEGDMQRAISDVRRDLLESEEEDSDLESGSDMEGVRRSNQNMSTHEKQRAAIAAEIRRLEAANVAKRDWTLSGEARAADRPLNSLIEEDLEFERVGKPVPVVTAEVSEGIEQLIKRRILAREFDEVVRRHPDSLGAANQTRRGRVELDDTKPQSGLAEIYEQDHLRATDPGYVDRRSAATKKQHEEISRLWKEVSSQLDLLSNLHFKPKRVEVEIKTVEDKPTISMEDARPVGMGINAEESMLAPQEVYRPGEETKNRGNLVVRKGGASVSKEEMTREEKLRKRRREKERMKKAQGNTLTSGFGTSARGRDGGVKKSKAKTKEQEKADILSELRKGNVKVVGKKGELQDLGGKKGSRGGIPAGGALAGGALKL
ncbi:uncharacterized protein Z520_09766 [Fonsecaea multimorphosa CBS 102226]|uniref:U3 small nucleolar ribonucleoprotein protein MPP10 n=1 Tax=Fonsecaea multimorphosa CBS 102226 TaxID=1442371 RepID=A0A0D2GXW7_9EURO|nr:uncharacterized protein Z520_09766 [Fonsecaea multimorphosa CBS 102226]KIX94380.1 hypothetical protein Z520_09766 [Fonsecaea multimorphosa CBS 102226]OAL20140.1 hypothetical protein AYO22_09112 [Fonsecaea multimorphosa]